MREILHEDLRNLTSYPKTVGAIKLKKMKWVGQVARKSEILASLRCACENNIKLTVKN